MTREADSTAVTLVRPDATSTAPPNRQTALRDLKALVKGSHPKRSHNKVLEGLRDYFDDSPEGRDFIARQGQGFWTAGSLVDGCPAKGSLKYKAAGCVDLFLWILLVYGETADDALYDLANDLVDSLWNMKGFKSSGTKRGLQQRIQMAEEALRQ